MATKLFGYAATFYNPKDEGTEYQLATDVVERVMPSAFDSSLASGKDILGLWNHNPDFLLGRRSSGTLRLSKDTKGLRYEIDYNPDDPQHASVYQKLLRGDVIGSSFSFTIRKEDVRREGGGFVRELHDVNLIEVSPVWRPAYTSTTATARGDSVRAVYEWQMKNPVQRRLMQIEEQERDERFRRIEQIEADLRADRLRQLAWSK